MQVLLNLLNNAVKFTEKGKITVNVLVDNENVSDAIIEVIDTGSGIDD